ncbi:hypothetical protein QBC43DRAFT_357317 [Cladorrhinum sp. PSN259]|nr:hypothetical protein QBC43DRAFT_357317 [Cladorrhinum sp. PSN259]
MALGSENSSAGDATSHNHQSTTPDNDSGQPPFGTLPIDDAASHFYPDEASQLYLTYDTATSDLPADHTFLLDPPARLPVTDGNAIDRMLIVDDGAIFAASPVTQSSGVMPGFSADILTITTPSLNTVGPPQPTRQEEVKSLPPASILRKRPLDEAQSPIRPAKRLSNILPKPLPAQTSSAGGTSTMTSNSSPKSSDKRTDTPLNMLRTWRADASGFNNLSGKRSRSTKVCLRCQSLRQKTPTNSTTFAQAFPKDVSDFLNDFEVKLNAFLKASRAIILATRQFLPNKLDAGMLCALFSSFSLNGIPTCEASAIFISPPTSPWRAKKLVRGDEYCDFDAVTFFLSVTQRRNIAKLAGLSEREAEIWLSVMSSSFFEMTTKLLSQVTRGKASPAEKESLGYTLVILLFACEARNTYVLQAAERTLAPEETPNKLESLLVLAQYILKSPEQREHLRLWARHWLRKLYGDREGMGKIMPAVVFCTLLSSFDIPFDVQFATEGSHLGKDHENDSGGGNWVGANGNAAHEVDEGGFENASDDLQEDAVYTNEDDSDGWGGVEDNDDIANGDSEDASDEDEEEDGDARNDLHPSLTKLICDVLNTVAKFQPGHINQRELRQRLNISAFFDIANLFPRASLSPV